MVIRLRVYWQPSPSTTTAILGYTPLETRTSDMPLRMRSKLDSRYPKLPLGALSLLLLLGTPLCKADSYYRWQDAQGNHHYGDTPADNARQGTPAGD
jgi:hypothetical protein